MNTSAFQRHLLNGLCLTALVASTGTARAGMSLQGGKTPPVAVPQPIANPAQVAISAQLQPQSIGLGESAQLAVTVKGSQAAPPNMPNVDGLKIVPVGQKSSM